MANNLTASNAARSAALNAMTALLNVGGVGTVNIYSGAQPATPDVAIGAQVLLATLTFSATAFAAAVNGVATANAITSGTAVGTNTAAWARLLSGGGTAVFDCTVGVSGCDINVPTIAISTGENVSVSSFTLTHP